ncbi:MAG: integrase core domain-containing protein [Fibrobacter sp.]|nr:integrase core domain-containing protein [Fibrobacter sp.]
MVLRINQGRFRSRGCDTAEGRGYQQFISHEFQDWCDGSGIKILYTQPGCPTQNSYIERFNGSYRRAVLDAHIFRTRLLKQTRSNRVSVDENRVILYTLNQS